MVVKLNFCLDKCSDMQHDVITQIACFSNIFDLFLYLQILLKYRDQVGSEPVRRCGLCGKGEGDKLKRCANCTEVYCSRECQVKDWETGHKKLCSTIAKKKWHFSSNTQIRIGTVARDHLSVLRHWLVLFKFSECHVSETMRARACVCVCVWGGGGVMTWWLMTKY